MMSYLVTIVTDVWTATENGGGGVLTREHDLVKISS